MSEDTPLLGKHQGSSGGGVITGGAARHLAAAVSGKQQQQPSPPPSSGIRRTGSSNGGAKGAVTRGKRPDGVGRIPAATAEGAARIGPHRTTRTAQKLKLLPEEPSGIRKQEEQHEVYSQVSRIMDRTARRHAERLGKAERDKVPRVTAFCTAGSYRMKDLARYLAGRKMYHTNPRLFDECLYTPFSYRRSGSPNRSSDEAAVLKLGEDGGEIMIEPPGSSDVYLFEYGVVVLWGFSVQEEQRFLRELGRFESEKLAPEDVQVEEFNYYITNSYQPRIYNDYITLRDGSNYMVKLSISHAIAQSVKISLFEELVDDTIEDTQDFPQEIASTGKINMNRKRIMMSIGELFILRININLHGSILDSPELMWAEPHLEPVYQAARSYLEINQRVTLLNQRVEVISDLLQMLKEQLGHTHNEYLEVIVIVLIAIEIIVAVANIIVDIIAEGT